MRIKYETKKKEDEIALLSKENELNEIRINHARKEKAMFILIAFSLLILSGLLYILYTIRKRTNKLLKEKNKELHLLNSTKDKFISILAHDLKNPFSAFLNISETLHNEFDEIDMERKKKYIERIYEASKQINNLLKNILQWAVIQNNPRKIETTLLNLHETTNEVCRTLAPYIQEHNVQVENFIPPGIQVYANRTFLITILNNLITNAVKFSENGNPVQVSASADKRAACVTVTDQGIGIAPQDIEKLFRMDIDTHTIGTSKEKGSGMGPLPFGRLFHVDDGFDVLFAELFLEHGPHGLGRFHEGGLVHIVVDLALSALADFRPVFVLKPPAQVALPVAGLECGFLD